MVMHTPEKFNSIQEALNKVVEIQFKESAEYDGQIFDCIVLVYGHWKYWAGSLELFETIQTISFVEIRFKNETCQVTITCNDQTHTTPFVRISELDAQKIRESDGGDLSWWAAWTGLNGQVWLPNSLELKPQEIDWQTFTIEDED